MAPRRRTLLSNHRLKFALLAVLALVTIPATRAQQQPPATTTTCSNYGTRLANNTCSCPSGFGGPTCATPVCGNSLLDNADRPLFAIARAGDAGSSGCNNQCTSGWVGPTCNVPTTTEACASGGASGGDVVAVTGAYVWTEGFTSCSVVNPTLQGVFPGETTLTLVNTVDPTLALTPATSTNDTLSAAIWYAPLSGNTSVVEQFYCKADTCTQTNTTSTTSTTSTTVNWECVNLQCTCIPGAFFCGGGNLDLTDTINGLDGTISVSCDSVSDACAFKQTVLETLFGAQGLALSGCQHGECVRQSTIASLSSQQLTTEVGGRSSLSHGVIAGLAVVGALIALVLAAIVWGWIDQRKARADVLPEHEGEKDEGAIGLRWEGIGYALPSQARTWYGRRRSTPGRVILDNLGGELGGGHFLAILGPTGAGKSTFVDLLAGKRKRGERTGQVELVMPESAALSEEKVKIGIVDQHDVLPATSTVREALHFAANLKMRESISREEKEKRVFEVLQQLGLVEVADSIIGSNERRGISGGERRRLSIGLELLATPAILICDEPTSGLDSVSAMRVVQVLKNLSNPTSGRRTTVVTTIHQPSSKMFHLFDQILLLGVGGRQVYFGKAKDADTYFAMRGAPVPSGWNPADHLLELACAPSTVGSSADGTFTSRDSKEYTGHAQVLRKYSVMTESDFALRSQVLRKFSSVAEAPIARLQAQPVTLILTQFQELSRRELRNLKRDWTLVIMHSVVSVLVGLFVGGLYYKVNLTIGGFQSRIGSLFFLGSLLAFSSLSALSNFANVKSLFLRERAGAYYSPVAWFASRVVLDIVPLRIFPTVVVSCIVYWMVGLAGTAAHFFKFLLVLVLFNIVTTLWNLFLAALIDDAGISILVSSVLNLFQMAFAGFFVNIGSIPPVLRWLQWISPLKYTLEALAVNEVSNGLLIKDTLEGVKVELAAAVIMKVLFGFESNAYYRNVLVLFGFLGGFAVFLVTVVVWKLREMR